MNKYLPSTQGKSDGDVLTLDSTAPDEVSWQTPSGGGGGGDNITINTTAATNANFNDSLPAAPAGSLNVVWQIDTAATPDNVSAHVVTDNTTITISGGAIRRAALSGDVTAAAGSNSVTVDQARGLRESGGTTLTMATVADGEVLYRTGTTVDGVTVAALVLAGLLTAWTDPGYGDGADGGVTYTGNTTLTEELRATDVNIDTGVTVTSNFPVRCTGTLSFDSSTAIIAANGNAASGTTGGTPMGTGYAGGWFGTGGANGRATTGSGASSSGRAQSACTMLGSATTGQGGDGGASGGGNSGGVGGTNSEPNATTNGRGFGRSTIEYGVTGTGQALFAGSGGGAGGCTTGGGTASSGAGGGAAGIVSVWSHSVDASAGGSITANGGNGSNATFTGAGQAGGGGGGGGGVVFHQYATHNTLPTLTAAGGTKGTGANGGSNGTDGNAGITRRTLIP